MKNILLFSLIILLLTSCYYDENPFGIYQARYKEIRTVHYVKLSPDSTFCHVYEKDGKRYEHKGTFRLYKIDNHYEIDFDDWKDFDERSIEYKKHIGFRHRCILLNNGQIFFDFCMDFDELNFKKE